MKCCGGPPGSDTELAWNLLFPGGQFFKTSIYKDNLVGKSHKKYCEPKVPSKIIEQQHKQRQKWAESY